MMSLHDIHLPAAAFGADQPLAPVEHGCFGAVPLGHLGGVGLNSMPTILAHDNRTTPATLSITVEVSQASFPMRDRSTRRN